MTGLGELPPLEMLPPDGLTVEPDDPEEEAACPGRARLM